MNEKKGERTVLYESQKVFVKDGRTVIDAGEVGIFSSPTGSGKTLSLLMTVMEYLVPEAEDVCVGNIRLGNLLMERKLQWRSKRTKVFYTSRTHSQLLQAVGELRKMDVGCNAVVLGSRRQYCVNEKVRCNEESGRIDLLCRETIKEKKCEFYDGCDEFHGNGVFDVEELMKMGRERCLCPYYVSKMYSEACDIVFLPYQLLFTLEGRKSAGIDVRDAIVIVDEGHNICDAVIQMNTEEFTLGEISECVDVSCRYRERYKGKRRDWGMFDVIVDVLRKICVFWKRNFLNMSDEETKIMKVSEFVIGVGIEDINMLEIEEYVVENGIVGNVTGGIRGMDLQLMRIVKFLSLLVMSDEGGRVFCNRGRIKFTPMEPSMYFRDVLECKAMLIAGGTMEPLDILVRALRGRKYRYFCYEGVCNDFLPIIMKNGPSGREIIVNYETRENEDVLKDVVASIRNMCNTVKRGGVVCFVPSGTYMQVLKGRFGENLDERKILYEDCSTFEEYRKRIENGERCILFAVVGGRYSEGINFKDDLCRLLVVVGVPYPTPDVEMRERMKIDGDYSVLVAMRRVNQALGRALRHKDDFAVLVLLDKRYIALSRFLSPWIKPKVSMCNFRDGFMMANRFLSVERKRNE